MRLCASDPLCAEHYPIKDGLTLHGSLPRLPVSARNLVRAGNKYLDRGVLVSTVVSDDLAFFKPFAGRIPKATITAETDESITPPQPVKSSLTPGDELVD